VCFSLIDKISILTKFIGVVMVIDGFKGRTVCIGDKVRVYRNLNNGKWSIKAISGEYKNKVVAHLDCLTLQDVTFVISDAGRARVIREGRKNVHAYAVGFLKANDEITRSDDNEVITYDPYRCGFFYALDNSDEAIDHIPTLLFSNGKAFI